MRRVLDFLRTADVPLMARRNYVIERRHLFGWGVFAGIVEGNMSSIVAAKTFGGSGLLVITVWATPMLANVLSFFWAALAHGRPKLRLLTLLGSLSALSIASVGLVPSGRPWAGWLFAAQVLLARLFLAGVVAVRSSIWSANYPRAQRARLVSRLQGLRAMIGMAAAVVVSQIFDLHPDTYCWVYPLAALVGAIALLMLRALRVRGEARELAAARRGGQGTATPGRSLAAGTPDESDAADPRHGFLHAVRQGAAVLKRDRFFARYCAAQSLLGSANFMVEPVLNLTLTQTIGLSYFACAALMDTLPNAVMLIALPIWAPYFDRVGVLQFRVRNSAVWVASFVLVGSSMLIVQFAPVTWLPLAILVLIAGRMLTGIGSGGGAIAWHIGHLHFARHGDAGLYMGVHMALTGLRGITMPYVSLAANRLIGNLSFILALLFGLAGLLMFRRLAREDQRRVRESERRARKEDVSAIPAGADAT